MRDTVRPRAEDIRSLARTAAALSIGIILITLAVAIYAHWGVVK